MKNKIQSIRSALLSKEISCTELTKQYLTAISKENYKLNAYVHVCDDVALAAAAKVDKKIAIGEELLPLEGIPMTLKDNICTKDIKTTCCSKMLSDFVPIYNSTVWDALNTQNAVLLGKTNMDEFAMGSSSETSVFGGSLNPYNHNHVAGGSSGGVASAVGGGIAAYGLGSDTGGSIRQPASFCGIVGLKPTYGAVSRFGLIAYASSFDQIGPITSSVRDCAAVFNSLSFYDKNDATSSPKAKKVDASKLDVEIKGKKIGVIKEFFTEGLKPDVKNAVMAAIEKYKELGAEIVELSMPNIKYAVPVYYILACAEASSNLGRYDSIRYGYKTANYNDLNEMVCKTRSEGFGKEVQHRILLGTYVLSSGYYDAYYKKAQNLRQGLKAVFAEAFQSVDAIIAPTVPSTAFELNFSANDPVETYMTDICTVPANITGLPALSVPCGFDSKGLPVGVQLIGNYFDEETILHLAAKLEDALSLPELKGGIEI